MSTSPEAHFRVVLAQLFGIVSPTSLMNKDFLHTHTLPLCCQPFLTSHTEQKLILMKPYFWTTEMQNFEVKIAGANETPPNPPLSSR